MINHLSTLHIHRHHTSSLHLAKLHNKNSSKTSITSTFQISLLLSSPSNFTRCTVWTISISLSLALSSTGEVRLASDNAYLRRLTMSVIKSHSSLTLPLLLEKKEREAETWRARRQTGKHPRRALHLIAKFIRAPERASVGNCGRARADIYTACLKSDCGAACVEMQSKGRRQELGLFRFLECRSWQRGLRNISK